MKSYFRTLLLCTLLVILIAVINSCRKERNPPNVTTSSIEDITQSSVVTGGKVINDGGEEILSRGVCWSINSDPTINDFITNDGTGTGAFTSVVSNLSNGTTYYLRAYATNSIGTGYGKSLTFTTVNPSTNSAFKPTGVIPATEDQMLSIPTIESIIEKLLSSQNGSKGTPSEYYIEVPTPNNQGDNNSCTSWTVGYGMLGQAFKVIEGHENYSGLDKNFSPSYIWNQLNAGINIGTPLLLALNLVRKEGCCKAIYMPYISNIKDQPTVEAKANAALYKISSIYRFGNVDINYMKLLLYNNYPLMICMNIDKSFQSGDLDILTDGKKVWKRYKNLIINPLDMHSVLICGYDDNISAFKILNSWGTAWANGGYCYIDYEFIKKAVINLYGPEIYVAVVERPKLTTTPVTEIKYNYAIAGGKITNDYDHPIIQKGICWSSSNTDPSIADYYTSDGEGTGSFNSVMNNLMPNTLYFVKAYAINSEGISYGLVTTFTTPKNLTLATVSVNVVSNYTQTTATCGGNVTNTGGASVSAKGVCWSTSQNPTIANNHTTNGTGLGSFTSNLTGLTPGMTYYVRAYATNSVGTAYSTNQVSFTTAPENPIGTVTDIDGNVYNTVTIGSQIWMKENLKVTKYNDNSNITLITANASWSSTTNGAYCWYNNDVINKTPYGALYNWYAVNTGKLCPTGWHVPTDSEWKVLRDYLGGTNIAGGKIKEAGTIHWRSPNVGATNESGFTGLPAGHRYNYGTFAWLTENGYGWTSLEYNSTNAWYIDYRYDNSAMGISNYPKNTGFSVRCLEN